ncbi:MAG: amino acid permease [Sinomicrobium sp.]|nr:amino acid permease [Sinomicrobium sp.]
MRGKTKIGWKTASGLVIANMIGTGVFTSLGFQLTELKNTWTIVLLWSLGGVMALIGAFTYAELGTRFRRSGGDYVFLSEIFHPVLGYLYAWISLVVGFSAPVAIAAMAMTGYLSPFLSSSRAQWLGIGIIVAVSAVHSVSVRQSGRFQNAATLLKVAFIAALIGIGFWMAPEVSPSLNFDMSWKNELLLPGFAVSLIYVSYAYTGWNAAAYIIEEIDAPRKNLPRALISGTLLVTLLYVLLQVVLLKHASLSQLEGRVEIATIAFSNLFPVNGNAWISFFIALQLIGTISGYIWVGPRITQAMAGEFRLWKPLSKTNASGIPVRALWLNSAISIALALTGSFEQVVLYTGFVLQLMGTLSVASLLFVKRKEDTFKSPWRPVLQLVFILFSLWVLGYMLYDRPLESLSGLGVIAVGAAVYLFDRKTSDPEQDGR